MDYETKADPLDAVFEGTTAEVAPKAHLVRPVLSGGSVADPARAAFVNGYLRRGSEVELKSFSGSVPADGGYAVPKEIDATIDATLKSISPIRAIANVVRVGSAGYRKLVTQNGVTSGWASETAARPETATPVFNEIVPSFGEVYANPAATQAMLDDAAFDVEGWLASEIATEFAKAEGSAFVNGDGVNKPKGFLTAPTATLNDLARPFGTLQYIASGAAGAFQAATPENKLLDLLHAVRAPYRQGASWVMNSNTLATIRKFKTSDGAFIWQPGLVSGQPDTLLGYPVETDVGARVAARALALLGTPFRLHGRCPEAGVDCVGLVAEALAVTGEEYEISCKYMLRGDHLDRVSAFFDCDRFSDVNGGGFRPGDIMLLRPAVRQLHFAILTEQGAAHAHAGLRRVVLLPFPWPVIGHWRCVF